MLKVAECLPRTAGFARSGGPLVITGGVAVRDLKGLVQSHFLTMLEARAWLLAGGCCASAGALSGSL